MSLNNENINDEGDDWHPMRNDVILDAYNCDLTMIVKHGCLHGEPMAADGLCSLWSGIRATYGMNQGRVAFQIKILRRIRCSDLLHNEVPFGIRVGWSVNESKLCLGEELLSYGYEETGKIWSRNQFESCSERYSIGDTITCYADFESEPGNALLSFAKNDLDFELAYRIDYEDLHSRPLFPHIFIKNISFQVNFGQLDTKFSLRSDFRFINDYHEDDRIRGTLEPSSKEECEVIMMVGLPGAGKSAWVEQHCAINTEKKYVVLSTNSIINQMKIDSCDGNQEMIDRAVQCLKIILGLSVCQKRNFIIDQTNVFANARRRKMSLFHGFFRRAVVVIPNDREYQRRRHKQQIDQGKFTPDLLVNQMKANFDLPEVANVFDDVEYAELAFRDAHNLVMYYRHQSQMIKETTRKNNRRKEKDDHWVYRKNNKQRSIQFNTDRHNNRTDLSFNHNHCPSRFHSKQQHRYLSSSNHRYKRRRIA